MYETDKEIAFLKHHDGEQGTTVAKSDHGEQWPTLLGIMNCTLTAPQRGATDVSETGDMVCLGTCSWIPAMGRKSLLIVSSCSNSRIIL